MKQFARQILLASTFYLSCGSAIDPAHAQITPDGTVPTNVSQSGNIFEISGGGQAGSNLFHSFQQFSLPTGNTAFFNNNTSIANIISRVTGGSISNIDGLIKANGGANLILINPNGIYFGSNARLDIGGSFLGSTASSVKFADGAEFGATNPQNPLLTVSIPVGLQMGQNPGAITVQGTGHTLTVADPIFSPLNRGNNSTGLSVKSGNTLTLLGGNINLEGGILTAEGGQIELGSVSAGLVNLESVLQGWRLGYEQVSDFQDINLNSKALLDVSGFTAGSIHVQGQNLSVGDGSLLLIQNQGFQPAGNIFVNAVDTVEVSGTNADGTLRSSLTNETVGAGQGGDVEIAARHLVVQEGATVVAKTVQPGTGKGGNLNLNASESVQVMGASVANPRVTSSIVAATFGVGDSGNNTLLTGRLTASGGGTIATATFGSGQGGNINLQVQNSLKMDGFSQISSENLGTGDGGDLTIETGELSISDGAFISATTFGEGKGGNVAIRATDSVGITGTGFEEFQQTFQAGALLGTLLPTDRGTGIFMGTAGGGASGHLTMETPSLGLDNGAVIFSPTFTEGEGGNITIQAFKSVELSGSAVQAGTSPGSKGSAGAIQIDTGKLTLGNGATIVNSTIGDGAGGNVEISALESVELQNTPLGALLLTGIYTNTVLGSGAGGDIRIDTSKLSIRDGVIGSNTGASLPTGVIPLGGPGGSVIVNATESIEIAGIQPDTRFPSGLGTTGFSQSPSGDVTISTQKLIVRDGADVSTAALGAGQGGNLTINASESIKLIGTTIGDLTLGGLSAASGRANLPELEATGASGNIKVTTKDLVVRDGASIDVQSLGSGDAGNLEVVANSIVLDNQGTISATTAAGEGGNINLQSNSLLMRQNSQISATAGGTGNGGNIIITGSSPADFVVLLEGSEILANAFEGVGGNIGIDAKALFVCPDCRISASSQLGVEGLVTINRLQPNTELQVINVPQEVAESEEVVALACSTTEEEDRSEFIITGRGGLPPRPTEPLSSDNLVNFDSSSSRSESSSVSESLREETDTAKLPAPARGWYVNSKGVLILAAQAPSPLPYSFGLTTPKCYGN